MYGDMFFYNSKVIEFFNFWNLFSIGNRILSVRFFFQKTDLMILTVSTLIIQVMLLEQFFHFDDFLTPKKTERVHCGIFFHL